MTRSCLFLLLLVACDGPTTGDDAGVPDAGTVYETHCENIGAVHCLSPWPSSFYLVDDPSTTTGRRIDLPLEAMPTNRRAVPIDPTILARFDGFSPMTPIMTGFAGELDPSVLFGEDRIADTLTDASATVLIDVVTGEQIAHFAEIDLWDATDTERAPLYLRPAMRLEEGRRYVVAIRRLRHVGGSPVEPTAYFAALRDGTPLPEASDLESRRAHFEEVFGILEDAGVERAELIQAWDFETASGESAWGDLVSMRDDAYAAVGADGIGCTVTQVLEGAEVRDDIFRIVRGTFTVPLFLEDFAESTLRRDSSGRPMAMGTVEVPFDVLIPMSVRDRVRAGTGPGRLLTYGHGLVSALTEIETGWHMDHASRLEMVSIATDWIGLTESDLPIVFEGLRDGNAFPRVPERMHQGIIDMLVLTRTFRGTCRDLPELAIDLPEGGTAPSYDPAQSYYYGNSMGGAIGTTYAALSTDVERVVVGVNGVSFPTFLKRSSQWRTYGPLVRMSYRDVYESDLIIVMLANLWDLIEASTYAPHVLSDPLPGSTPKRVLMHIGLWDTQVANISSAMQARSMNLPLLTPSPFSAYGLEETAGPVDSAMVVYDTGAGALPSGSSDPGDDTGAHEAVRRVDSALEQIDLFLRPDGVVEHTCDGACDPD